MGVREEDLGDELDQDFIDGPVGVSNTRNDLWKCSEPLNDGKVMSLGLKE